PRARAIPSLTTPASTHTYTLSLHDALPIYPNPARFQTLDVSSPGFAAGYRESPGLSAPRLWSSITPGTSPGWCSMSESCPEVATESTTGADGSCASSASILRYTTYCCPNVQKLLASQ